TEVDVRRTKNQVALSRRFACCAGGSVSAAVVAQLCGRSLTELDVRRVKLPPQVEVGARCVGRGVRAAPRLTASQKDGGCSHARPAGDAYEAGCTSRVRVVGGSLSSRTASRARWLAHEGPQPRAPSGGTHAPHPNVRPDPRRSEPRTAPG